jgi:hypothetical protein
MKDILHLGFKGFTNSLFVLLCGLMFVVFDGVSNLLLRTETYCWKTNNGTDIKMKKKKKKGIRMKGLTKERRKRGKNNGIDEGTRKYIKKELL